jgi:hypothetical protein
VTPNFHTYQHLSPQLAQELLSIYRTRFPHKGVSDEAYAHVVRKLDERAAQDQSFAKKTFGQQNQQEHRDQ